MGFAEEVETGVADAPIEAEGANAGDSPSPGIESGDPEGTELETEENEGAEEEGGEGEEELPFGQHPRWVEQVTKRKAAEERLAQLEAKLEGSQGPMALQKWLQEDPEDAIRWMARKAGLKIQDPEPENGSDPYEQFEPEVAERFRKYDSLLKEYEENKSKSQVEMEQRREQEIRENRSVLDAEFDELATKAGFYDEKGNYDEEFMDVVANATLSKLHAIAENPHKPTKAELNKAFGMVTKGLKAIERRVKVTRAAPPPTGSKRGSVPPTGEKPMSEQERLNDIANSF